MQPYYTHGSSRIMTPARREKLCELLAESHTLEEASEAIGVSIRTVQRERKRDEDFDHEVLLALQKTPDPLKLMEQAARTHWRAAAWLLERQNPEQYARKPVNTTSPKKVAAALRFVQEAALHSVPEEFHETLYQQVQAAIDEAFAHCFPTMGKWEKPKFPKLPVETPLVDRQEAKAWDAPELTVPDRDEHGNVVPPPPVDPAEVAARQAKCAELKRRLAEQREAQLSPQTREATRLSPKMHEATAVACDAPPVDPLDVSFEQEEAYFEEQERLREQRQRNQELRRAMDEAEERPSVLFPSTAAVEPSREQTVRRQERQRQRAAEKKAKAARKRAAAQRRRAA